MFCIKIAWLSATLDNSDRQAGAEKKRYFSLLYWFNFCIWGNLIKRSPKFHVSQVIQQSNKYLWKWSNNMFGSWQTQRDHMTSQPGQISWWLTGQLPVNSQHCGAVFRLRLPPRRSLKATLSSDLLIILSFYSYRSFLLLWMWPSVWDDAVSGQQAVSSLL